MSESCSNSGVSRRSVLLAAAGAAPLLALTGGEAQAKLAMTAVKYQPDPKDGKQCDGCNFFVAPNSCKMVDGDIAAIVADPACFDGAAGFATLMLAPAGRDPQRFVDGARAVQAAAPEGVRAGVTAIAGLVVARWLAADAALLRRAYADLACHLRCEAMGLPRRLPRIWHV